MGYKAGEVIMRKLLLPLLFMAGTVNAASSVKEICTDYTKYLGHVYGFTVSQDGKMKKALQNDMTRLSLSEAMVQQEMYKVATDDAAKMYYSKFLNPNLNEYNRSAFKQMVAYCETAPDMMIPSWAVLVANGKIRKEDQGKSLSSYINSEQFLNARGMRTQNTQGALERRALGIADANDTDNLPPGIKKCVETKLALMKQDSPNIPVSQLTATATSLCKDGL